MKYKQVASEQAINQAVESLQKNGITAYVTATKSEAKKLVNSLIPLHSSVMTMTSESLREIGLEEEINSGDNYESVKKRLYSLNRETDGKEMRALGSAPDYAIGSVHAVTVKGELIIASNTGSQLPAYAYGAANVIWVVGAQKIVKDLDEGFKRIEEYVLPLESERARVAYGVDGSYVSKLLIIKREVNPSCAKLIIVKEALGY